MRMCACRGTAGFAHVSCLAEQAKILCDEAEENNLDAKAIHTRYHRWTTCSLCEQNYHGLVECALGWACWKTYLGRPEADMLRVNAMNLLGNGLFTGGFFQEALSVYEADLSMIRRLGTSEDNMLAVYGNLASTYQALRQYEQALRLRRDVYSGILKLRGEENEETLRAAFNYASTLFVLKRYKEVKSLMRKATPVARRVLGEGDGLMLKIRCTYAEALYKTDGATLDNLREAVGILAETERTARRVLGAVHPTAMEIEQSLRAARTTLRTREGDGSDHAGGRVTDK